MRKQVTICDITGEEGAVTLRWNTGKDEYDGVENTRVFDEIDIHPDKLVVILNNYFKQFRDTDGELIKAITKDRKTR